MTPLTPDYHPILVIHSLILLLPRKYWSFNMLNFQQWSMTGFQTVNYLPVICWHKSPGIKRVKVTYSQDSSQSSKWQRLTSMARRSKLSKTAGVLYRELFFPSGGSAGGFIEWSNRHILSTSRSFSPMRVSISWQCLERLFKKWL